MPNRIGSVIICLALGAAGGYVAAFLNQFVWSSDVIDPNRAEIVNLFRELEPGQPDASAAKAIVRSVNGAARVYSEGSKWYVSAPAELFQSHWVLVVCLKGSVVDGVRIGVADDLSTVPPNAPNPKGTCT